MAKIGFKCNVKTTNNYRTPTTLQPPESPELHPSVVCPLSIHMQSPVKTSVFHVHSFLVAHSNAPNDGITVLLNLPPVTPPLHTPHCFRHLFLVGCCVEIDWSVAV